MKYAHKGLHKYNILYKGYLGLYSTLEANSTGPIRFMEHAKHLEAHTASRPVLSSV